MSPSDLPKLSFQNISVINIDLLVHSSPIKKKPERFKTDITYFKNQSFAIFEALLNDFGRSAQRS